MPPIRRKCGESSSTLCWKKKRGYRARRNGNVGGLDGKGKLWMGERGGNAIRRKLCERGGVGARCLVVVRILCIEIGGDNSDLPLHE